nr:hypothetical protein [Rhodococcus wratislaviensis]
MQPGGPREHPWNHPRAGDDQPPLNGWDVAVSAAALVVAVAVASISAVAGLFWLLFLDYCPRETCSAENAWIAVCVALAVAALATVIGGLVTIARIARRTIAWPVACGTLILCAGACAIGFAGYVSATGI